MSDVAAAVIQNLAPTGVIRAAINTGNLVLARKAPDGGEPSGVSVEIAREIGRRLGHAVQLIAYVTAGSVVNALARGEWDVPFLAEEPARADWVVFSALDVVIEGTYMLRTGSPFTSAAELDQDGIRIAVGLNAAYDLHLTRALRQTQIMRAPSPAAALELFYADRPELPPGSVRRSPRCPGARRAALICKASSRISNRRDGSAPRWIATASRPSPSRPK